MYQVLAFIKYWLLQVDEHSLHSPFVYQLYQEKIKQAKVGIDPNIEALRHQLKKRSQPLEIKDYGAGSRVNDRQIRQVKDIAKTASTPPQFSALLHLLIEHFEFTTVLELGTSLGLNSLYMSKDPKRALITFEGDPQLCQMASTHFEQFDRKNIQLVQGNIDDSLQPTLNGLSTIDMAYIDANHRYKPTLTYYQAIFEKCHPKSMIVLDDIHWSKEMNQAWEAIKARPEVSVSIDLFEGGLLFFDPDLTPGHYVLKF